MCPSQKQNKAIYKKVYAFREEFFLDSEENITTFSTSIF